LIEYKCTYIYNISICTNVLIHTNLQIPVMTTADACMTKEADMDEMKAAWNETFWPWANVTPPIAYKGLGVRVKELSVGVED
jgi:hypothetical protein